MRYVCNVCGRMSTDGNLWCEQVECPAGNVPVVLNYGEFLGDIKIVRLLRLFRTAAIYEAERQGQAVLLKVAHRGHDENLKREAAYLARFANAQQPALPVLIPAYAQGNLKDHAYGKAVFRDDTKYYEVFQHVQGEFLRDTLLDNPQPWYLHAAWITIALAKAVAFLHTKANVLHLNISPDIVMVTMDKQGVPHPLLLDLGLLAESERVQSSHVELAAHHIPASYIVPELLTPSGEISQASDVYGLGIMLYEMLAGQPAFEYRLRKDADIREAVRKLTPEPLNRRDLPDPTQTYAIVTQAIDKTPARRQQSVGELGQQLVGLFGNIPPKKRSRIGSLTELSIPVVILIVVVVLLVILVLALLGSDPESSESLLLPMVHLI